MSATPGHDRLTAAAGESAPGIPLAIAPGTRISYGPEAGTEETLTVEDQPTPGSGWVYAIDSEGYSKLVPAHLATIIEEPQMTTTPDSEFRSQAAAAGIDVDTTPDLVHRVNLADGDWIAVGWEPMDGNPEVAWWDATLYSGDSETKFYEGVDLAALVEQIKASIAR